MVKVSDIPFTDRAGVRYGARSSVPEGQGDIHFDTSTNVLSIADTAGTSWLEFDMDSLLTPVFALGDATDVSGVTPATNDVLTWNGTIWAPAAPSGGGGGGAFVGCQVSIAEGSAQTYVSGSGADLSWVTEDIDTDALFDAGNPTRLTIPTGYTGKWRLSWTLLGAKGTGSTEGEVGMFWYLNNNPVSRVTPDDARAYFVTDFGGNYKFHMHDTIIADFTAGDYIELFVTQNMGSDATIWGKASLEYLGT